MNLSLDLQLAKSFSGLPSEDDFQRWARTALEGAEDKDYELSLRIVDTEEMIELNHQYRHKNKATNVLSFPADLPEELNLPLLGDIVICAPIVEKEACEQEKTLPAHWAHMLIHGMLHLLGYDHLDDDEADTMEALEINYLARLGFTSPYS